MKLLYILLCIAILSSCNSTNTEDEKLKQENIAVVEKYIQAVQNKDIKTVSDLLADDYMGYGPGFSDSINKAGAVENYKYVAENLYDKITYARTMNLAATLTEGPHPGNYVSNWAHLTITYKDGRGPINLYANTSYRIENGKIAMTRTIYDQADAMRQLGYEMQPVSE
jgi:ketosteroid isomerase-like protein